MLLWPELGHAPDQAANKLRDCLNPDRREKLSPEQFVLLLRKSREAECHAAMGYLLHECGYAAPEPVDAADTLARAQDEFAGAVAKLDGMARMIERLAGRGAKAGARAR